jgi:large subunit ribosomal protein L13
VIPRSGRAPVRATLDGSVRTFTPTPRDITRSWHVIDADGMVLGRLATEVARLLRGKHKPIFAPHMDTGDHVIVINADKIELTGQKAQKKFAYRHSGYPGGIKAIRYDELLAERPVAAIEKAVRGMLPHNRLGRQIIKKLHIVAGPEHPHAAQQPEPLAAGERPVWQGFPTKDVDARPAVTTDEPAAETTDEPTTTTDEPTTTKKTEE